MRLFNATNGGGWTNSSGWPTDADVQGMDPVALAQYMAAIPVETRICISNTTAGGPSQSILIPAGGTAAAALLSDVVPAVVVLPDHCCWYGISCCSPQTCGNDPFCNCTTGLVTSIQLNGNQVRMRCKNKGMGIKSVCLMKLAGDTLAHLRN